MQKCAVVKQLSVRFRFLRKNRKRKKREKERQFFHGPFLFFVFSGAFRPLRAKKRNEIFRERLFLLRTLSPSLIQICQTFAYTCEASQSMFPVMAGEGCVPSCADAYPLPFPFTFSLFPSPFSLIAAVQKYANLVELEKCCQTHIFLQNFVLIQPRLRPPKICKIWQFSRAGQAGRCRGLGLRRRRRRP